MAKKMSFTVQNLRPVCRTPIKPVQKHTISTKFSRKVKHPSKGAHYE
jgi:hypothetical protein